MFTLVPSHFFNPATAREALAEVADLKEGDTVGHLDLPQYDAVLVYTTDGDSAVVDGVPEIYRLLEMYKDGRQIYVFRSREEADAFLRMCKEADVLPGIAEQADAFSVTAGDSSNGTNR